MKYICHDCGNEIPDDMDFCPRCGGLKEKSTPVDDNSGMPLGVCPKCGARIGFGDSYCGSCGAALPQIQILRPKMRKCGGVAMILALIPGFFNIFGLGHLLLKSWSKGFMFIALTLIMFYVNGMSLMPTSLVLSFISVAIYFYQAMDLVRVMYVPEVK